MNEPHGQLMRAAAEASKNAYAPYSRFRVGAAVLTGSGRIYTGTNVENISYPLGICGEAAALAAARLAEGDALRVKKVAVWAHQDGAGHVGCSPCGGCRQRILELGPQSMVEFFDGNLCLVERTASELLPDAFSFSATDHEPEAQADIGRRTLPL